MKPYMYCVKSFTTIGPSHYFTVSAQPLTSA
jgi:hypothetical protein